MTRERIDWTNLGPLPRKKATGATREDLAARKFNMAKAKHKGRCHISNQKRRQIAREKASRASAERKKVNETFRAFKARVRAFWLGETEQHP